MSTGRGNFFFPLFSLVFFTYGHIYTKCIDINAFKHKYIQITAALYIYKSFHITKHYFRYIIITEQLGNQKHWQMHILRIRVLDIFCIFLEPLYPFLSSVRLPDPYDSHLRVCMSLAFQLCLTSGEPGRRSEEFEEKRVKVYRSLFTSLWVYPVPAVSLHRRMLLLLKRPVLKNSPFFWNCKLLPYLYYLNLEVVIVVLMLTSNSSTIHYDSPIYKPSFWNYFFCD